MTILQFQKKLIPEGRGFMDYLKKMEFIWTPFLRGPFSFRWTLRDYILTSHIMTVSKHVERPGTKEPLKNHQRNVLSSCSHLVLNHNNFTFNAEHFLQINGTTMGTKMAPSYANIFMGKLEKLIIQSSPHKPLSWFHFIDDVDMKWTESEENLNRFFDHVNNVHPL